MYTLEHDQDTTRHEWSIPEENEHTTDVPGSPQQPAAEVEDEPNVQHVHHVYVVKQLPEEEDQEPALVADAAPPQKKRALVILLIAGMVGAGLLLGFAAYLVFPLVFAPAVTLTIIPIQQTIPTTTTITLVPGKPTEQNQLHGRRLPAVTISQRQQVPTTGIGHQDATAASGTVTLYNAAPFAQFVPAGTLLVGADGVQVVTDSDVTVSAASMPLEGQAAVSAHAVQTGTSGNIPAYDINGACCRANVFARNTLPFSGGMVARDFPMVTRHNVDSATASLKASLLPSINAALQAQLKQSEGIITPICTPAVSADHPVGSEATTITVTMSETCSGVAYDKAALQQIVMLQQTQESINQLGSGYNLSGTLTTSVTHVNDTKQGSITFTVQSTGVWAYHFSDTEFHHLATQIAGKTSSDAIRFLLGVRGVRQVTGTPGIQTLPSDPEKIHLAVLYEAA